jgi:hypothetical protein
MNMRNRKWRHPEGQKHTVNRRKGPMENEKEKGWEKAVQRGKISLPIGQRFAPIAHGGIAVSP